MGFQCGKAYLHQTGIKEDAVNIKLIYFGILISLDFDISLCFGWKEVSDISIKVFLKLRLEGL